MDEHLNRPRMARLATLLLVVGALAAALVVFSSRGDSEDVTMRGDSEDSAVTAPAASSQDAAGGIRLTPDRSQLPKFPPTSELNARAATSPSESRTKVWPGDTWSINSDRGGAAFPVFSSETDQLAGIHVAGLGLVSREEYEDPEVDFEKLLIERIGEEEYDFRVDAYREYVLCREVTPTSVVEGC